MSTVELNSPTAGTPSKAGGKELPLSPGKAVEAFRVYAEDESSRVYQHYKAMRSTQTVAFVRRMEAFWLAFDKGRYSVREIFDILKDYVDASDPDTELPNMVHMVQTAEAIRKTPQYADCEWMQLVGLLHDVGKVMFRWGRDEDGQCGRADGQQFALGGDTWVVGCPIPDCAVLPQLNGLNPDSHDPRYNATPTGMYKPGCGMMNVSYAWGHDEYIYRVLLHNGCAASGGPGGHGPGGHAGSGAAADAVAARGEAAVEDATPRTAAACEGRGLGIPLEGLAMLRLHSCYPWHTGGAYGELMDCSGDSDTTERKEGEEGEEEGEAVGKPYLWSGLRGDARLLAAVRAFNVFDLYTKSDAVPTTEEVERDLWPYYQGLIDKYLGTGKLDW